MEKLEQCPVCGSEDKEKHLSLKDYFLSGEDFSIDRCKECGFLFTNPRPYAEKLGDYYKSDEYISHSNTNKGLVSRAYKAVRSITLKQKFKVVSRRKSSGRILDIGSGTGELLNFFRQKGWEVQGVEPDADARSFARSQYNLPVEDEEFLDKIPDNSFDVISMWHVLEHVPNLNARIETLSRILKDDGIIVIAVPNPESFDANYYGKFWAAFDVPRHLYHFRKQDIKNLFDKRNFRIHQVLPMKFDSFYVSLLSEKYKSGGKMNYVSAFLKGYNSNQKAKKNMNYSSLIYILSRDRKE